MSELFSALSQEVQQGMLAGKPEVTLVQSTPKGTKLHYFVTQEALQGIMEEAGHSHPIAARASGWILKKVSTIERWQGTAFERRTYGSEFPPAVISAPTGNYLDLSAVEDVIGFANWVDSECKARNDLRYETSVMSFGPGVEDAMYTMVDFYDFACEEVSAQPKQP